MKSIKILLASKNENAKLAQQICNEIKKRNVVAEIINLCDFDLPLYYPDGRNEPNRTTISLLAKKCIESAGFVFVIPEYNGGVPPLLSNAFCWLTLVERENWRSLFSEKAAAIASHSGGSGQNVVRALAMQLEHMGMNVIGRKILTNKESGLNNNSLDSVINQLVRHSLCGPEMEMQSGTL